ncbi:sialate O-acetylesterase [Bremerella sp. JC817]|uniref:sialate O-acetylesterase n=1 Tax=Bremerella sp. JC817 TaxID=3231756 RepID=UPI003459D68F
MKRNFFCLVLLVVCAFAHNEVQSADLTWASPFQDHMVLQRNMPVTIWGKGTPRETVDVQFDGQTASAKVDDDGKWMLHLKPIAAGGPHVLSASSAGQKIECRDVLVGEVWICSGQSNMQMGYKSIPEINALAEKAKSLPIRCLRVTQDVSFEPRESCECEWIVGPGISAVATTFANDLQQALDVPVGVIETCWGSSSIEGWMPRSLAEQLPHFRAKLETFDTEDHDRVAKLIDEATSGKRWQRDDNIYLRTRPNILYNAMLHPLAPLTVRGMVWYQGESNSHSIETMQQYGETLSVWTKFLRKEFDDPDFQMLAVMLPRFGRIARSSPTKDVEDPTAHGWAWIRESQARLLELPNTALATTIDLGHMTNIHPTDKRPVGKRLALKAQALLSPGSVEDSGPMLEELTVEGSTAVVQFSHAAGLKTTDGKAPTAFWIAGKDRQWKPAEATIEGTTVRLTNAEVPKPVAVRYAFASFPEVNLVNADGLPAVPFRTDRDQP